MVSVVLLAGLQANVREIAFRYVAEEPLKSVHLAGTFNAWNKGLDPMVLASDGRTWTLKRDIPVGRHQYRFVLDGQRWTLDPANKLRESDGAGNINSLLVVEPKGYDAPAKPGDGAITAEAVHHIQKVPQLNVDRGRLTLTLEVRPGDVQSIAAVLGVSRKVQMRRVAGDQVIETYRVEVPYAGKAPVGYHFELIDGAKTYSFGPDGLKLGEPKRRFVIDPKTFKAFEVPGWVERSVFYQIFPDRFANGDPKNDPKYLAKWDEKPTYLNRYGGDTAGIGQRIGYLKDLGVNAVYLNPVMKAPSNHRYDPVDFYRVDPEIGKNQEFGDLTRALHGQGIRVVLDQIFDHVGTSFPPFADLLQNQEKSRYRDWFHVKKFPVKVEANPNYEGWFGHASMPKLNMEHPDVCSHLLESVDFWHKNAKLSGWRLDVANEVPMGFWREFRKRVKAIDRNAWILGEVWTDARPWLAGDQWDASMNYPFRGALLQFVAKGEIGPGKFLDQLFQAYHWYAPQVARNQFNMISSHDTPRFITEAGGDARLHKLAAVVQFAWAGAPSVYYGEELGMEGGKDPDNRRGMAWDKVLGNPMLAFYRRLIALRLGAPVLQSGDPVRLAAFEKQKVAAFGRVLGEEAAVVVVNRSNQTQTVRVPVSGLGEQAAARLKSEGAVDVLSGKRLSTNQGFIDFRLSPFSSALALTANVRHRQLAARLADASRPEPVERKAILLKEAL